MNTDDLVPVLRRAKVLPVLRSASPAAAAAAVGTLVDAGLGCVELTTSTPGWEEALRQVRDEHPDLVLGMGTVTTAEQARAATEAGADFLVSPYPAPEVREAAPGIAFLEGGFTPGEVAAASRHGVAKLFPAFVGGPRYLSGVLDVLPGALVVPTGGIGVDDVPAWLDAGAVAVGVGRALLDTPDLAARLADLG